MRYFFEVAYDGTRYHGWQAQQNAHSVQAEITDKLATKLRHPVEIVASGRTDAGVHATQQIFHIDTENEIADNFLRDFNGYLPADIAIKTIKKVRPDAHARFDAQKRSYEYRIITRKDPFLVNQTHYVHVPLEVEKMNEACQYLLGERDFQSFSKVKTDVTHFVCTVQRAEFIVGDETVTFHISANRFLRGMVRAIVGTLLEVGTGGKAPGHLEEVILSLDRKKAGAAAPACGLFLTQVEYPPDIYV